MSQHALAPVAEPSPPTPLEAEACALLADLAFGERRGHHHRFTALITALEVGEIAPASALGALETTEAEIVRRVALGFLLDFRTHLEGR